MNPDRFWHLLAKNLSKEASEPEKEELRELLSQCPELAFAAQQVTDLWTLNTTADATETEAAFYRHLKRLEEPSADTVSNGDAAKIPETFSLRKATFFRRAALLIIPLMISVALVLWLLPAAKPKGAAALTEEIHTQPGTRTRLVLPDSSVVWLNAGSKLRYSKPFGDQERTVNLTGEAFFDVARAGKPFVIFTAGVRISVLGTAFNVRSYAAENKVETSLVRGRLEVSLQQSPDKKYTLYPNEKLTLNTAPAAAKSAEVNAEVPLAVVSKLRYLDSGTVAETSWVQNKLLFDDESFEDVARKIELWYGVNIRFETEDLKAERLTGVFERETVWQALEALQVSTPFEFSQKNNDIILTR